MKAKKNIIIICCLVLMTLWVSVIVFSYDEINAFIVSNTVYYQRGQVTPQYPLISYNDHVYISVRDVGKMMSKNVEWDNKNKEIKLTQPTDNHLIKTKETAEAIAKVVIMEHFPNEFTEYSLVSTMYWEPNGMWLESYFETGVIFNPTEDKDYDEQEIYNMADIRLKIDPINGNISVTVGYGDLATNYNVY